MINFSTVGEQAIAAMRDSTLTVSNTLWAIGLVGVVSFPLYYLVWHFWLPQPYENLLLRLVGMALCGGLVINQQWPNSFKRWLPVYWHLCVFYCLPFFFSFMYFMNEGNLVWVLSALTGAFLLIMLVDWLSLLLHAVLGTVAGGLAFLYVADQPALPPASPEFLAILLFGVIGGAVFSYRQGLIERQRTEGMSAATGIIAHELRTPLASITLAAQGIINAQATLVAAYHAARDAGLPVRSIRAVNLARLDDAPARIQAETARANFVIDLLLTNLRTKRFNADTISEQAIHDTVITALRHYPFRSDAEKNMVKWQGGADFTYVGPQLLVEHVLFNLLKNALHFTEQIDGADIDLWTTVDALGQCLHVRDSGQGIPAKDLPHVFDQFYSRLRSGQGTGLGLFFSKQVMEGLGGSITCRSEHGKMTEFILRFPRLPSAEFEL